MIVLFGLYLFLAVATAKKECVDKRSECARWKDGGFCKTMVTRMRYWCPKTCDLCPVQTTKIEGECGISGDRRTRIIGGVDAVPGAWPWIASLQYNGQHTCGGTLLSPRWVLTASHCVGGITQSNLYSWTLTLGSHDHRVREPSAQRVHIRRVIKNPHWNPNTLMGDLTLFELATPVKLNKRVNIACLPEKGVYPPLGKECMLAGWGSVTHPGGAYHTLQQVKLPVVEMSRCRNHMEDVCVGKGFKPQPSGSQQPNACRGDSGGPLVCQRADGTWQLDGVASFVYTYCKYYTAYAPVNKYLDWINSYIKN